MFYIIQIKKESKDLLNWIKTMVRMSDANLNIIQQIHLETKLVYYSSELVLLPF